MPKKPRRGMDSELAAICENGKPECRSALRRGASSGFQGARDEHRPLAQVWNEQFHDSRNRRLQWH
ncbi:hypothetical protein [Shewanella fodinae]|uniref:hypothetical protein n=1 Tax=Shewanella fodinae TaxID=552357 RepID=UPI0016744E22|nr:hypothetical protein [Shewanella fodinae]MCL2906809.1 hypothetical protein [Shewanella fodinae]